MPELVQVTINSIKAIRESLKITYEKQKGYVDHRPKSLDVEVEDKVFLKL